MEEALVMLSDILPTGYECGVLNGKVSPGSTVKPLWVLDRWIGSTVNSSILFAC